MNPDPFSVTIGDLIKELEKLPKETILIKRCGRNEFSIVTDLRILRSNTAKTIDNNLTFIQKDKTPKAALIVLK